MTFEEIETQIRSWTAQGKTVFATSSFQTHSVPLLHMLSRIDHSIPIVFLNTGYLFPATIAFRDLVTREFNLNLTNVLPQVSKANQRDETGQLYFTSNPELCCYLNKVQPLEPFLERYDVWITGIRGGQTDTRRTMPTFVDGPRACLRFHPVLDWTMAMIRDYIVEYHLPSHPLDRLGYQSIGCEPCTARPDSSDARSGRWIGQHKTECGLHTDLATPSPCES
jgi:phosphoadenosine phosphosulfate reductase